MQSLKLLSVVALGASLAVSSYAKPAKKELCHFAPKNNRHIPVGHMDKSNHETGINEAQFEDAIKKVVDVYAPIVQSHNATLTFNHLWEDDTVNSDAYQTGNDWYVDAYGGLARYPNMTEDGMVFVFCHEMGHHLGGAPKFDGYDWASVEGQADYFASMKCFRRIFKDDNNAAVASQMTIAPEVSKKCSAEFHDANEVALCERSSQVGLLLANVLYDLGKGYGEPDVAPQFSTPSQDVVSQTDGEHPLAQCRLDTYFNGAICPVSYTDDFSDTDPVVGACAEETGATVGYRPHCWYAPGNH